jgi:predicted ATP-grasp superfamily ATP-dependent carboligase
MLSLHKQELSKHFTVPVPDYDIAKLFLDKKETYNVAIKAGIPIPLTIYPSNMEEASAIIGKIKYPIMIKPRNRDNFVEIFNTKLFIVNKEEDLKHKLELCFRYKLKVIITEIIPGDDTQLFAYNFYISTNGNELAGACQQKLRQSPPNYGIARVMKTVVNNDVIELSRRFLNHLPGFFGQGHLEFKYDIRDRKYKLMEMNGRITLQNELFAKAGVNFPYIYYQEWSGTKPEKINKYTKNIYWINLWEDIYNTLFRNKEENYSFLYYLKPYLRKNIFAIERLQDPKPAVYFWLYKITEKLVVLGTFISSKSKKQKDQY